MAQPDAAWQEEFLRSRGGPPPALGARAAGSAMAPAAGGAGDPKGLMTEVFLEGVPPGYGDATPPDVAAWDYAALAEGTDQFSFWPGPTPSLGTAAGDVMRARRVGWQHAELSSWLPVLEDLGLSVIEAVPWHLHLGEAGREAFIDDLLVRAVVPVAPGEPGAAPLGHRLVEAVGARLSGLWAPGAMARLVISAGLSWPEVDLLAAVVAFRRLVGGDRAADRAAAMSMALLEHPAVSASLVGYFAARHPALPPAGTDPKAVPVREDQEAADAVVQDALSSVPDAANYEALREVLSVLACTVSSTWPGKGGMFSLKFESGRVRFLPEPRPWRETFVYSPGFEGVHLRFGPVARGGIRWSDRAGDLRTEILGLARAQVKKNSLIVPTGAKGGFVLRAGEGGLVPATSGSDAYSAFVGALLDVTDAEDPYLVVAPDKGTGRFSDLANEVSTRRGFWLGDAFASGGSHGYDHRALAITAKGAWLAVQRHFRALGLDPERDPVRVAGVGDMTGDVFGNAMLLSRSVNLVAAFDHRHVFIDPSPDAQASFEQRLRLSRTPGSTWADYDMGSASAGAVVLSRNARAVDLAPAPARAIGLSPGTFSPDEVVRAVLKAPVDLLFFGGIGTFVKAPAEADSEVDDRANDEVRVGADELRARAVVEGANLGLTQRARISYSRRGGRVNTDFVDNAGGVAMSDREVNLKILLGAAQGAGLVSETERDLLLAEAAGEMASGVLDDVDGGIVALDVASEESAQNFSAYRALMEDLSTEGLLNPAVESMPGAEELERRQSAGAGFARPELAVIVAFARSELARAIEASDLAAPSAGAGTGSSLNGGDAGAMGGLVAGYFPSTWRQRFSELIGSHPLYRQLAASRLANEVIAIMGPLWAHELGAESGAGLARVASCYWAAATVIEPGGGSSGRRDGAGEGGDLGDHRRALDWLARWYLWSDDPLPPMAVAARQVAVADELEAVGVGAAAIDGPGSGVRALRARAAEVEEVCRRAQPAGAQGAPAPAAALRALLAARKALHAPALELALSGFAGQGRWAKWVCRRLQYDLARGCVVAAVRSLSTAPSSGRADGASQAAGAALGHLGSLMSQVAAAQQPAPQYGPGEGISLVSLAVRAVQHAADIAPATALMDAMAEKD
ncbi:MAG TPA: NAD-glutamate dehydrogenase domain-containing protein [Acidimicrobiales bacterium]|nr:NAD-glutamate dehydrogenase domain-containing protein [Acidimicrobiales bacterium]